MNRRRRWLVSPLRLLVLAFLACVVYVGITAVQVIYAAHLVQNRRVQAIVVLGAAQYDGVPSPDLAARLSHALVL